MGKRENVITVDVDKVTGVSVFKVKGAGEFTFDPRVTHPENQRRAMVHGYKQRISDAGAMSLDTKDGAKPDPAVRLAAMKRQADHFASGTESWSIERVTKVPSGDVLDPVVLAAVIEATGKARDEILAMVAAGAAKRETTPRDYLNGLGGAKLVKPILDRMLAERAPAIDADAELDGLMGEEG